MEKSNSSNVYSADDVKPAPDTNNLTLEGPKVREGGVVRITAMYVVDRTTANKTLRLGYDKAGTKTWFKRQAAGSGAYGIAQNGRLILVGGEKPVAMVESPTASDDCALVVRGEYL